MYPPGIARRPRAPRVSPVPGRGIRRLQIVIDDGRLKKVVTLNQPHLGLHIPPGIWAFEQNFSSGLICIVLASHTYDAADYVRDYEQYLGLRSAASVAHGR